MYLTSMIVYSQIYSQIIAKKVSAKNLERSESKLHMTNM